MKVLRYAKLACVGVSVAGCMQSETASRNITFDGPLLTAESVEMRPQSYRLTDVRVNVPQNLVVSEANSIKPRADIVWRGDIGLDRHNQIKRLVEEAAARGVETSEGELPVIAEIELEKFHGLTQYTRYRFNGDYDIHFSLTLRDALSGEVLEGPRQVEFSIDSPGPRAVTAAEARGYTERMFVLDNLSPMIAAELN